MVSARLPVFDRRRAGVLLPMFSLDAALGRGGRAFIDWLAEGQFSVWQILPVGPVGSDRSPYWVRSDFAGNPAFLGGAARSERTDQCGVPRGLRTVAARLRAVRGAQRGAGRCTVLALADAVA